MPSHSHRSAVQSPIHAAMLSRSHSLSAAPPNCSATLPSVVGTKLQNHTQSSVTAHYRHHVTWRTAQYRHHVTWRTAHCRRHVMWRTAYPCLHTKYSGPHSGGHSLHLICFQFLQAPLSYPFVPIWTVWILLHFERTYSCLQPAIPVLHTRQEHLNDSRRSKVRHLSLKCAALPSYR